MSSAANSFGPPDSGTSMFWPIPHGGVTWPQDPAACRLSDMQNADLFRAHNAEGTRVGNKREWMTNNLTG